MASELWRREAFKPSPQSARSRVLAVVIVAVLHGLIVLALIQRYAPAITNVNRLGHSVESMVVDASIYTAPHPRVSVRPISGGKQSRPQVHAKATDKADLKIPVIPPLDQAAGGSGGAHPSTSVSQSGLETAKPADSPGGTANIASVFQRQLFAHIENYRRYPTAAQDRPKGVVELIFAMDRSGAVLGVWIKQSSGSPILDQEAVATVLRAQPLPPIPPDLPDPLNITLPISFNTPG